VGVAVGFSDSTDIVFSGETANSVTGVAEYVDLVTYVAVVLVINIVSFVGVIVVVVVAFGVVILISPLFVTFSSLSCVVVTEGGFDTVV